MKITAPQRKRLEAAGYTISKSGTSVQKDGKTVGGYNANGQIFSGSAKVKDILKSKPEAAPKAASAPKPRASTKAAEAAKPTRPRTRSGSQGRPSVMSDSPTRPAPTEGNGPIVITTNKLSNVRGGRGDGAKERIVRTADRALANAAKATKPAEAAKPNTKPKLRSVVGNRPKWSLGGIMGWGDKKKK